MRYLYYLLLIAFLSGIAGCSNDLTFKPEHNLVVVQAYIYAGESINDVKVTGTLGLGSTDSLAPLISDAQVQLVKNDTCYALQPIQYKKGYYYYGDIDCPECPAGDLVINAGDVFTLEVLYYDKVATAVATVPPPPQGISLSTNRLVTSEETYPGNREFGPGGLMVEDANIALTVGWSDDGNSMYYVELEHMNTFAEAIVSDYPHRTTQKFYSSHVMSNSIPISWSNITHYGDYRVKLFRLGDDYLEMYLSRNQDTRDLNEPISNVDNGLGIFTALNSATVYFRVDKQ